MDAHLGKYAFGFTWGAWAAIAIAMILLFLGCGLGGRKEKSATSTRASRSTKRGGLPFFGRKRRNQSHVGSVSESQRRVKDEYA